MKRMKKKLYKWFKKWCDKKSFLREKDVNYFERKSFDKYVNYFEKRK